VHLVSLPLVAATAQHITCLLVAEVLEVVLREPQALLVLELRGKEMLEVPLFTVQVMWLVAVVAALVLSEAMDQALLVAQAALVFKQP
jgi:hypothetical protein